MNFRRDVKFFQPFFFQPKYKDCCIIPLKIWLCNGNKFKLFLYSVCLQWRKKDYSRDVKKWLLLLKITTFTEVPLVVSEKQPKWKISLYGNFFVSLFASRLKLCKMIKEEFKSFTLSFLKLLNERLIFFLCLFWNNRYYKNVLKIIFPKTNMTEL